MQERTSMNNSRSGSLGSDFSVKPLGPLFSHTQLIKSLVKRILSKLSFGTDPLADRSEQKDEVLQQTIRTLEQLSRFKLNSIVSELINVLDEVSTRRPSARDGVRGPAPQELVRDALLILKILAGCMQSHWTYCKDNAPLVDIANPGLDPSVAQNTLRISIFYAHQSVEHSDGQDDLTRLVEQAPPMHKPATDIIRYISASNWGVCNGVWKQYLQNCSVAEGRAETRPLRMIENMCLDLDSLGSIIKDVAVFGFLPKRAQDVVAVSLRKVIMSWIDENPEEFVKLYTQQGGISYQAEKLFDIIVSVPDSSNRRDTLWPLAMCLAIFCPETVTLAIRAILLDNRSKKEFNYSRISKKTVFLDNVRQCLKIDGLCEIAAICMTDFAKAVYLLPRDQSELARYILNYEKEVYQLIFDPSSRLYKNNKDRTRLSQLVFDKLIAIYRADPKEFNDVMTNKAYFTHSNTYITFNMARFWREYNRRMHVKLNPDETGEITAITAPRIRRLLQHLLQTHHPSSPPSGERPQQKGAQPVDKADLIIEMLRSYIDNIDLALTGTKLDDKRTGNEDKVEVETAILDYIIEESVQSRHPEIAETGADLVELLYAPQNAWRWTEYAKSNSDEGHLFWLYTYPLTFVMAMKVINTNIEREIALQTMQRLNSCYNNVIEILKSNKELIRQGLFSPESIEYLSSIETSLLISLCSSNMNISKVTVSLFQQLHEMSLLAVEICGDEVATMKPHFEMCERLSTVSLVVSSRLAIQKAFRKALSQITDPTQSITAALGTAFEERDKLSKHLGTPPGTRKMVGSRLMDGETIDTEWRNYSCFLASLGGCWYSEPASDVGQRQSRPESISNKSVVDSKVRLKNFLKDQCRYLASEWDIQRETVSKMLSTDLSPRLFGLLFEQLDEITSSLFDTKGQPLCKEGNTSFVDQAVSLLKGLVDRITEPVDIPPYVDFGGILQSFCEYLERLSGDHAKQIKVKMCSLCELVASKRDVLNLKHEVRLMNNLLAYIYNWAVESDGITKSDTKTDVFSMSDSDRLQRYVRAMANITVGLPLTVPSEPDVDPAEAKSKLFKKYFDYFAGILHRCRVSAALEGKESDRRALNVNKDFQTLLIKSREHSKDLIPLRESTIKAISNLVNANVEAGLSYCLSMAYTDDARTNASFMQLFTKMLDQRVDFEDLDDALPLDRIERIIEVLTSDTSFGLAISTACPANYVDHIAPALLHMYDARGLTMPFVKNLIENEVNKTENASIIFRGNNAAPRIITAYIHSQSGSYLKDTLGSLINDVIVDPRLQEFSVSSSVPEEQREENLRYIQTVAKLFFDAIVNSPNSFPLPLREMFHHISVCTAERFRGNNTAPHIGVGSIVFLRFIGPAISIPEPFLQSDQIVTPGAKRALVLVTKMIQNLASNSIFPEEHMRPLNTFLESNIKRMLEFIRSISSLPSTDSSSSRSSTQLNEVSDADVLRLYDFIYNNSADVKKALFQLRSGDDAAEVARARVQMLTTMINQLGSNAKRDHGTAQETPPVQISSSVNISDYHEFMERSRDRNIEMFKSAGIFYNAGVSRANRPVLCFVTRFFDFSSMDLELFTYYICHTLESVWNNPFEVFIDVTGQSASNEVPIEWIANLLRGLPRTRVDNCAMIYHYNVNTPYRRQLRTIFRHAKIVGFDMEGRSRFLRGLEDAQRFLDLADVRLCENTIALDIQAALVFEPVWRIITKEKRCSVSLKVGQESVQVIYADEQQVTGNSYTPLCDVIFATDIDDINVSSYVGDENEFVLKGKSIRLVFSSPKRHDIIQGVQSIRAAMQDRHPVPLMQRGGRPSSLPGTLLNAVFLNLPHEDQYVRLSAWNLLCALNKAYHIEPSRPLRPAPGLFLPPHHIELFVGLSREIATQAPHLSLDIISAFLEHFSSYTAQQREYGLYYLEPWIPQLETQLRSGHADFAETSKEIKSILRVFIRLTDEMTNERSQLGWYTRFWPAVGKVTDLSRLLLVELFGYAVDFGFGSKQTDTAARILLTSSTVDMQGQVITRLRESIQKIIPKSAKTLVDHPMWKEVAVLLRLCLTLSFDNWQLAHQYLPEIMYIVTVTVACGPSLIRSSTHAFLVNTVQSLVTHTPVLAFERQKLERILEDLSSSKYTLLFGLTSSNATRDNAFSASANSANDAVDALSISGLETIVTLLIDVVNLTSSIDQSNARRSRWLALISAGAFRNNPAIQPRLLVALGCLADSEVDDALIYQLVNALRHTLEESPLKDGNEMILNSLIFACTKMVGARLNPEYTGPESTYLHELFWLGVAILQVAVGSTYPLALTFVETCLKALAFADALQRQHLPTYLRRSRKPLEPTANTLDNTFGINFNKSFSFSMAALLAKGLKQPGSRATVRSAAGVLLELSSKNRNTTNEPPTVLENVKPTISFQILPYLAILIPTSETVDALVGYLTLAGLDGNEFRKVYPAGVWKKMFNDGSVEEMLDNETALLLLSLTTAILATCKKEEELLLLYTFFAEAAPNTRSTFPYVYDELIPRMADTLLTSSNIPLLETMESILCTTTSDPEFGADGVANYTQANLLEELGFSALVKDGLHDMNRETRLKASQLASEVAGKVLSVWKGSSSPNVGG